jgi:hypothetical protein
MNEARSANATIQKVLDTRERYLDELEGIRNSDFNKEAKSAMVSELEKAYKADLKQTGIDTYDSAIEALRAKISAHNERFNVSDDLVRAANLIKSGEVPAGTLERITSGKSPLEIEYLYNVANESKRTRQAIELKSAMEAARFEFDTSDDLYFLGRTPLTGKFSLSRIHNDQTELERVDDFLSTLESGENRF